MAGAFSAKIHEEFGTGDTTVLRTFVTDVLVVAVVALPLLAAALLALRHTPRHADRVNAVAALVASGALEIAVSLAHRVAAVAGLLVRRRPAGRVFLP